MSSTDERDSAGQTEPMQSPLTQAQKLDVIGQVAGGVAHDFNNRLAVILGYTGLLLNEPMAEPQRRRVEAVHHAVERAAGYLALGLTLMLATQTLVNLGVVTGVLPTKGLPLPFNSFGGSALLMALFSTGVLLNISQHAGTV